jgi:hypothetical protein
MVGKASRIAGGKLPGLLSLFLSIDLPSLVSPKVSRKQYMHFIDCR